MQQIFTNTCYVDKIIVLKKDPHTNSKRTNTMGPPIPHELTVKNTNICRKLKSAVKRNTTKRLTKRQKAFIHQILKKKAFN